MGRVADALKRAGQLERDVEVSGVSSPEFPPESSPVVVEPFERERPVHAPEPPHERRRATGPTPIRAPERAAVRPQLIATIARPILAPSDARLVGQIDDSIVEEEYRTLATALHRAQQRDQISKLVVTSAVPKEGKTLSAANLSVMLSRSFGRRVLLIDADLRKPSLHSMFGTSVEPGLTDALVSDRPISPMVVRPRLWLLPAGTSRVDPANVLASEPMALLLEQAAKQFDWVIIDTPPVVVVPDARLLSTLVHAAILVVRAGQTSHALCHRARQAIVENCPVLGVVLNAATPRQSGKYSEYYR